jgi:uncharacterized protein (TIGR00251 family)
MSAKRVKPSTSKPLHPWLSERVDSLWLTVMVQAGAKRSELIGLYQECLKLRIAAPPVDGAANLAVVDFFAKLLKIKKNCIKIAKGEFNKRKVIAISSQNLQATRDILLAAVGGLSELNEE